MILVRDGVCPRAHHSQTNHSVSFQFKSFNLVAISVAGCFVIDLLADGLLLHLVCCAASRAHVLLYFVKKNIYCNIFFTSARQAGQYEEEYITINFLKQNQTKQYTMNEVKL